MFKKNILYHYHICKYVKTRLSVLMVNKLLYIFIAVTYFIKKRMLNDSDTDNIKYMVNSNHLW